MTGINQLQNLFGSSSVSQVTEDTTSTAAALLKKEAAEQSSSTVSEQKLELSNTGNALSQSSSTDDVRMEKVAQLQSAISAGTYNVSSSDVADKLMESMLNGR